jgi:hypothetical protein
MAPARISTAFAGLRGGLGSRLGKVKNLRTVDLSWIRIEIALLVGAVILAG